jgi:hypothetical protein
LSQIPVPVVASEESEEEEAESWEEAEPSGEAESIEPPRKRREPESEGQLVFWG